MFWEVNSHSKSIDTLLSKEVSKTFNTYEKKTSCTRSK